MTPIRNNLTAAPTSAPPKATPLQVLLAVADAIDEVAPDFLSRRELAAYTNIRLRKTALRESELEGRRAA